MTIREGRGLPSHTKKGNIMSVIADILAAKNIEIAAAYQGVKKKDKWEHHNWKVFISGGNGLSIDTEYSKGTAHDPANGVTADDLIPALLTDASFAEYDFAEFCRASGLEQYDPETGRENKKSVATFRGCELSSRYIRLMQFTEEEMQAIRDYIEEEGL